MLCFISYVIQNLSLLCVNGFRGRWNELNCISWQTKISWNSLALQVSLSVRLLLTNESGTQVLWNSSSWWLMAWTWRWHERLHHWDVWRLDACSSFAVWERHLWSPTPRSTNSIILVVRRVGRAQPENSFSPRKSKNNIRWSLSS